MSIYLLLFGTLYPRLSKTGDPVAETDKLNL